MGHLFYSLGALLMLNMSIKVNPPISRDGAGATGSGGAGEGQLAAAESPFEHDLAAEAIELGGTAAGFGRDRAGLLDQALLIDQAAEVRLVQRLAGQRLDCALQLKQGE